MIQTLKLAFAMTVINVLQFFRLHRLADKADAFFQKGNWGC